MSAKPCGCDSEEGYTCQLHIFTARLQSKLPQYAVTPQARNEAFHTLLARMGDTHDKKNRDYADAAHGHYYSNFEIAAQIGGCSVDTVFRVLIGVKLARLDELLKGKTPLHESIDDSLLDLSVYAALWTSYRRKDLNAPAR